MKARLIATFFLAVLCFSSTSTFASVCTPAVAADGSRFIPETTLTGTAAAEQMAFGAARYPSHVTVSTDQFHRYVLTQVEFDLETVQSIELDETEYRVQKRRYCSMLNLKEIQCQDECVRWSAPTVDHRT